MPVFRARLLLPGSLLFVSLLPIVSLAGKHGEPSENNENVSDIDTCGGSAGGNPCVFPFEYEGETFDNCTNVDHDQLWCATQSGNYDSHKLWGNCDCALSPVNFTCGGTANGAACEFPFTYKNIVYSSCTSTNSDEPWCATRTGEYSRHGSWGYCQCYDEPMSAKVTCGGNSYGAACSFPFTYRGDMYYGCTNADHDQPWCATQKGNYHSHELWGNCDCPGSSGNPTCGGTAHGAVCAFPFVYNHITYSSCTWADSDYPWCATRTGEYSEHRSWGYCDCSDEVISAKVTCGGNSHGAACAFPFTYEGNTYYGCTNADHNQPWCATKMGEFSKYEEWGNCQGCPSPVPVTITCAGTSRSAACIFPFKYNNSMYYTCTTYDHYQPWCSTREGTDDNNIKWGNCNCPHTPPSVQETCGGANCVFPFQYGQSTYYTCTNRKHNQPWCRTEKGDSDHMEWDNCYCAKAGYKENVPRTCEGTGNYAPCAFPFTYKGQNYSHCIAFDIDINNKTSTSDQLWCGTQHGEVEEHKEWGNCKCTSVPSTCDGNSNELPCQFPFSYKSVVHYDCISVDGSRPWCATQPGRFEDHGNFGYCDCSETTITCGGKVKGSSCVFPFLADGIKFYNCTSYDYDKPWCATEKGHYITHKQWGNCECNQDEYDSDSGSGSGSGSGSEDDSEIDSHVSSVREDELELPFSNNNSSRPQ